MSSVGCSAVARQAAKFTAVVVFPTPPFWLATAIIRAKQFLASENLANTTGCCKLFHVKHFRSAEIQSRSPKLFHVEQFPHRSPGTTDCVPRGTNRSVSAAVVAAASRQSSLKSSPEILCSTWNIYASVGASTLSSFSSRLHTELPEIHGAPHRTRTSSPVCP